MDWKGASIQIISVLIGSSLIITVVDHFYAGITQPHINIDVALQNPFVNNFEYTNTNTPTTNNYSESDKIIITNDGRSTAKELTISLYYPNSHILSVENIYTNENISWYEKNTHLWQTKGSPKLSIGGKIEINSTYLNNNGNNNYGVRDCIYL